MKIEEFTNKVDGICNDYTNFVIDGKEFRDKILALLLEVYNNRVRAKAAGKMPDSKNGKIGIAVSERIKPV